VAQRAVSSGPTLPIVGHNQVTDFAIAKVNLPAEYVAKYRDRVNGLRDRLETKIAADPAYAFVRSLGSGSVAKGTALLSTSDFDLAVYVKPDQVPADERKLSGWLIERLKEARPQLDDDQFLPQDCSVAILYRDGTRVEVVPVLDSGDGSGNGHLIQKDTGVRVLTNIPRHLEFIRKRKKLVPVHFRQVVRLLKYWARLQKSGDTDFRLKSFAVELLCARLLDLDVDMADYPEAITAFFSYVVKTNLREPVVFEDYYRASAVPAGILGAVSIIDPVNPLNNTTSQYTDRNRIAVVDAARAGLDALDYAAYAPTKVEAVAAWREVFGTGFQV
jgi:predicted nucleotidyltransferase